MIAAKGYGQRIAQAVLDYQSQIGRRYSYAQLARDVGRVERGAEWSSSAVTEWIAERSEPSLATFIAMATVLRTSPSWLAFGEKPDVLVYTKETADEDAATDVARKKRRRGA